MGDSTTCVYQFIFSKEDKDKTHIIQYFVMYDFGLCTELNSHISHMFYSWLCSHNKEIKITSKGQKYDLYLNKYTNVFYQGGVN